MGIKALRRAGFLSLLLLTGPGGQIPASADDASAKAQVSFTFSIWGGRGFYSMSALNDSLARAGVDEIKGGPNAGLEIAPAKITVPNLPLIKNVKLEILPTLSIEYLGGKVSRDTDHIITWHLNATGLVIAPTLELSSALAKDGKSWWLLAVKPIGVGVYKLGVIGSAKVTEQYVTGELGFKGTSVGYSSQLMLGIRSIAPQPYVAIGYRWLEFGDVEEEPSGEWTSWSESGTPFVKPIDYSGLTLYFGLRLQVK